MHGSGITPSLSPRRGYASSRMTGMHARFAAFDAAQASRQRSRLGLTLLRPVGLGMHARLAASDAWLRPHLALVLAWFSLASYGFACMLGSPALTHGSGLTLFALAMAWLCLALYGRACMLGSTLSCVAQASRQRSCLGLALPRLVWLRMHERLAASDATLMHGPGLTPLPSPWLGSASPRMDVHAC
jgi:hypothetical protein